MEDLKLRQWLRKNITTRCGSMLGLGMRLPRKTRTKLGHAMCVLCVIMWIDEWLYACVRVVLSDLIKLYVNW